MLRTHIFVRGWAFILSFISRVIAFLVFSLDVGDTDGCFVDMMGCKTTKQQYLKMAGRTICCSVLVVEFCARGADWELRLATAVRHHERVWYPVSLAWEKIQLQRTVSTECVLLLHIIKLKNLESNYHKSETIFCI